MTVHDLFIALSQHTRGAEVIFHTEDKTLRVGDKSLGKVAVVAPAKKEQVSP